MRTYVILLVMLLLTVSVGANAQFYPNPYIGAGSYIAATASDGTVTTIFDNSGQIWGMMMGAKNKSLVCANDSADAVLRVDPGGTVTTILADATILATPAGLVLDQDGNIIVCSRTSGGDHGIFKIAGSSITTVATTASLGLTCSFTGGLVRDVDTGDLIVQVFDPTNSHPMYKVAVDGSSFTTVHTGIPFGNPKRDFCQNVATGHYYVGSNDTSTGGYLLEVTQSGVTTIKATVAANNSAFNAPVADRGSAAAPRVVSVHYNTNIYYADLGTGTVTTTAVNGITVSPKCGEILYSRNIQTVLVGPKKWDMRLSFPRLPGARYALIASISGIRPGITLLDGRRILLNPDPLTYATLVDALPAIFNDGGNTLDANGEAVGQLNTSSLPPLGGLTMHILAIVEKPAATIAAISEPFVMRLP
jgi:hypothetical protein